MTAVSAVICSGAAVLYGAAIFFVSEGVSVTTEQSTPFTQLFTRLVWMVIGPGVLAFLAYSMASSTRGWFGPHSVAFLVVLAAMIAARRLDPQNSLGEPTAPGQLQRYSVGAAIIGAAVWAGANWIGNHLMGT